MLLKLPALKAIKIIFIPSGLIPSGATFVRMRHQTDSWSAFSNIHKSLPSTITSVSTLMAITKMSFSLLQKFQKSSIPKSNIFYIFSLSSSPFYQYPNAEEILALENKYLSEGESEEDYFIWKKPLPHSPPQFLEVKNKGM